MMSNKALIIVPSRLCESDVAATFETPEEMCEHLRLPPLVGPDRMGGTMAKMQIFVFVAAFLAFFSVGYYAGLSSSESHERSAACRAGVGYYGVDKATKEVKFVYGIVP